MERARSIGLPSHSVDKVVIDLSRQAELETVHVEIVKLMAEQRKLNAEAGKMTRETFWYPVAVATGMIGTVATVTTVLVKLL
ncbi:MAG: hypothetical protein ACRER3_19205 [Pseudomonas fluorescens]